MSKSTENNLRRHVKKYMNEFFEAFITLLIMKVAMEKDVNIAQIIKSSLLVGLLTFALETYNPEFKTNITTGLTFTAGSNLATKLS